jgi:Na+/H+ antiporter NhaC
MVGIVNLVLPIARTPRRGQTVIALLGLGIFFDDYANTMIVGNATRPVSDNLKISREKLAYLVDSTAAPVATIAVITTWIGFQVSLIEEAITHLDGIEQSAYSLFLQSIPFSFYPFLALFFVFLIVLSGRDFGPMYKAEQRARNTGAVMRAHSNQSSDRQMDDFQEKAAIPCRAMNALVPIGSLVIGVIGGMYISGEGDSLQDIIGSANAYLVLIWASLLACLAAFVMTLSQRLLTLNETVEAWVIGARFMLTGLVLLVMAWAVADVTNILQTASYLISLLGDTLTPQLLPTAIFLLAAVAGFASGSSWGVMAILMPLVIPLCWAVLEINGMANAEHLHILYSSIACVLCGAVWADHCSPLSDTTVLSSLATGCDHMDHVTTQLPYAALTGVVAILIGTLPSGYGAPWWLMLLIASLALFAVHQMLAKPTVDPSVKGRQGL